MAGSAGGARVAAVLESRVKAHELLSGEWSAAAGGGGGAQADVRASLVEMSRYDVWCSFPEHLVPSLVRGAYGDIIAWGKEAAARAAQVELEQQQYVPSCFEASCGVLVAAASTTAAVPCGGWRRAAVSHVNPGDMLHVADGGAARVLCVVRSVVATRTDVVRLLPHGPALTPEHPVLWRGAWRRPADLVAAAQGRTLSLPPGSVVYNFLLDRCHALVADGVPCVTLGHDAEVFGGARGGGASLASPHEFWGTQRVVAALRALPGWSAGVVTTRGVRRSAQGDIVGLF